jgi:flagellar protein FliJ
MTPMQPLITLLAQSESERDSVQAELTRVTALHQTAQAQSEQLVNYRRDYETRWTQQFQTASTMTLVQCYRGFIQRLTMAVEQQQVGRVRSALVAQELRVATVRKLIERRVAEDRVAQARKDQKTSDEFAARSAWNRSPADAPSLA